MKTALLIALIVAMAVPTTSSATHLPRPDPGTCADTGHGTTLCVDPPTCEPPAELADDGRCIVVPALRECRVLVRYAASKPAQAIFEEPARGCDRAGMELALAALLARLLGAP